MQLALSGAERWFDKGANFITPTSLTAAVLSQQCTDFQLRQRDSWERPGIFSVSAWLVSRWHEARYSGEEVPLLLSPIQERLLWLQVLEQEHPHLFNVNAAAGLARAAAALMAEWQIPLDGEAWNEYEDAQHFQRDYKLFRKRCRAEGWITRSDLWRLVPDWISAGYCQRETTVFCGFERIPPALEQTRTVLEDRVRLVHSAAAKPVVCRGARQCETFEQEIEEAARWARARFERQHDLSMGIFLPDVAAHRTNVTRIFERVFYPARALRFGITQTDSVFHVNAGAALKESPLIANALLLLELGFPRIAIADATSILRSPFVKGAAVERSARAMADLKLRRRRDLDVSLNDMEYASRECALLRPVWSALRRVARKMKPTSELGEWAQFAGDLLEALGWPGDGELSAEEQEIVKAWKNALSDLTSLGLIAGRVSYGAALSYLERLLSSEGKERGDWAAPVQILDASDVSGLRFDCACLIGLSDENWPPPVRTSPLIPPKIQRAHDLPTSSSSAIRAERAKLTEALFCTASEVLISYTGRLSPAVARFVKAGSYEWPQWEGKLPRQSFEPVNLDLTPDDQAPAFIQTDQFRGGTSVIKAQSLCPFRAFAERRLEAQGPDEACFGFDARDRGGFLHRALQNVWTELQTQTNLRAISDEDLRALVRQAVSAAVREEGASAFHELNSRAERERLEGLVWEWLQVERMRKQSFTVETLEQERYYEIPGLRLNLRVDRIDRLQNGSLLLIDYKSGAQTRGKLKCPRPAEPQLLVYAAAVGNEVDGVFFGQLQPRDLRAVGFSREKHFSFPTAEVKRDWDLYLEEARNEIERIANEFVSGHAAVAPIRGACEYCQIKPLCRVRERTAESEDTE